MRKFFFHFHVFFVVLLSNGIALSQNVDALAQQIKEISEESKYDSIGMTCYPGDSLSTCVNKLFLSINRNTSSGLYFLSSIDSGGFQSYDPLIHTYIIFESASRSSIAELKQILKYAKVEIPQVESSLFLLSDRQLLSYYHQLLLTYYRNGEFSSSDKPAIEHAFQQVIFQIEGELVKRELLPSNPREIAERETLLSKRFKLAVRINDFAVKEAIYFADNHPEVLKIRKEVALAVVEVQEIEKILGVPNAGERNHRDLFTDQTVKDRLASLEMGKKKVEQEINIKRGYASNQIVHLRMIEEAIDAERNWLYKDYAKRILSSSISVRGPPASFTLDDYLEKLNKVKESTFKQHYNRECKKWEVLNEGNPEWKGVYIGASKGYMRPTNVSEYLKAVSNEYYKTLPLLPEKANLLRIEFEYISRVVNLGTPPIYSPIQSDMGALNRHESNLKLASQNLLAKITRLGNYAPRWMHQELQILNNEIAHLIEVKKKTISIPNRERYTQTGDIFYSNMNTNTDKVETQFESLSLISNEKIALEIIDAQINSLEVEATKYGSNPPLRIERALKDLKEIRLSNDMSRIISQYRQYAPYANLENIIESRLGHNDYFKEGVSSDDLNKVYDEIKPAKQNIRAKIVEVQDKIRIDNIVRNIDNQQLKDFYKVKKMVGKGELDKMDIDWRPPQNAEKANIMKLRKNPGGIWLSPEGNPIPKQVSITQDWIEMKGGETCPDGYTEWLLNDDTKDKVCFPTIPSNGFYDQIWIKKIGLWF